MALGRCKKEAIAARPHIVYAFSLSQAKVSESHSHTATHAGQSYTFADMCASHIENDR